MKTLTGLSIKQLSNIIQTKQASVKEVVTAHLDQIAKVNPLINAVVVLKAQEALQHAEELDKLLVLNKSKGPLHGIPFTLKDIFNTKGDIVTAGTVGLKNNIAQNDSIVVQRLYEAGAVLLGKTNTPEFEFGCDTDNLIYGRTKNPYDLECSPGGSSGGGAALVASCGSMFDIGSDTGGSLRLPANNCGIATIRATVGRVPTTNLVYGQRTGMGGLFAIEGPLARNIEDVELLLKIISGPDGVDPKALPVPLKSSDIHDISKFKVAYFSDNGVIPASPSIMNAVHEAAQALAKAGAKITKVCPQNIGEGYTHLFETLAAAATPTLEGAFQALNMSECSPLMNKILAIIKPYQCDLKTFLHRWSLWDNYRSQMLQFMQNYDIMLCPVVAIPPLRFPAVMWDESLISAISYCWMISSAGLPAAVVRCGWDSNLPIGVQIIAKPWCEDVALAAAKHIECTFGGWQKPKLAF